MNIKNVLIFLALAIVFAVRPYLFAEDNMFVDTSDIAHDTNAFAIDLYKNLSDTKNNLFCSPYSIADVLEMTYMGAHEVTEKQMTNALHLRTGEEQLIIQKEHLYPIIERLKEKLNEIKNKNAVDLNIAASLWVQKDRKLISNFTEIINKYYPNSLNRVDFLGNPEEARSKINAWTSQNTNNRIEDFFGPNILSGMTRLVLASTVYFNAEWEFPFRPTLTRNDQFWISDEQVVSVSMMCQRGSFNYHESGQLKILELPYKNYDVSLFILLPIGNDRLPVVEELLTIERLNLWTGSVNTRDVVVYLPKFTINSKLDLVKTLSTQGMPDAFDVMKADFSGMDGTRLLYISHFLHDAFIDVDEFRTEAAAATAAVMDLKSAQPIETPIEFRADHPFMFFIRHNETGIILFIGKVTNPAA